MCRFAPPYSDQISAGKYGDISPSLFLFSHILVQIFSFCLALPVRSLDLRFSPFLELPILVVLVANVSVFVYLTRVSL